jgi:hypothetical protein
VNESVQRIKQWVVNGQQELERKLSHSICPSDSRSMPAGRVMGVGRKGEVVMVVVGEENE